MNTSLLLILVGCSDYGLQHPGHQEEPLAVLALKPAELFFGERPIEEQAVETVSLRNEGGKSLSVLGLRVRESEAFSADEDFACWLHPGDSVTLEVTYDPASDWDEGLLEIEADDDFGPLHYVELIGGAQYPELTLEPSSFNYGDVVVECGWEKTFTVGNAGDALLVVEAVSHSGQGFELTQAPGLPFELEPGEEAELVLAFAPLETGDHAGSFVFETNEPTGGGSFAQTGTGIDGSYVVDEWRQPDGPWVASDILFYVDKSGSMEDNQSNLNNNFGEFIGLLNELFSDYQIMVVTVDSGCHNHEIITPETADPDTAFSDALRGSGGTWTEAGLTITRNALRQTGGGECNEGFAREGAKLMPILVSDEPEQSMSSWSELLKEILGKAPTTSISAIVGDVPGGCPGAAAGYGYYEAVFASGGMFLSICDLNWGSNLQELAVLATSAPLLSFELSGRPVAQNTIQVLVNEVENHDWSYDEEEGAVVFESGLEPPPLAWVEISYYLGCSG